MNILNNFSLEGKVALITGGAGIYGQHMVEALLQAGAKTYVASRNTDKLEKLAEEFSDKGYRMIPKYLDQGDEQSVLNLRDDILKEENSIDILINNAVARPMSSLDDDVSKFEQSMKVNATGIFLMCRTFGDVMARNHNGSIINIGSIQGMVGPDASLYDGLAYSGFIPDYFFHKGGMINFTRFIASYYGKHNIRCNCINPGGFQTENHEKVFVERYSQKTLLKRMAQAEDIMGIIVFLASDASKYITGASIPVDGGYTAI
jgi:NAD(P)-dependent dehydrogenase (short-subunit alcohol dehydrogenase family)